MSWLTMRQESDCFLLPRNTILVVSHASRCNSWSFIPWKRMTRPMGWVLHTCTYVGNLPIDIPLFSKLAPSVSPQSWRRWNICKMWRTLGAHLATSIKIGQAGLLFFKKEIPRLSDIAPIRENVAGVEVRDYGLLYDNPGIRCLLLYTVLVDEKWAKGSEKGRSC